MNYFRATYKGLPCCEIRTGNGTEMFTIFIREADYSTEDQVVIGSLDRELRHIPLSSWR
jgi:hypothetical protein